MKDTTMQLIYGIIIFVILMLVISVPMLFIIYKPTGLEKTSTENVYKIWDETPLSTTAHNTAHRELNKRKYWESENRQNEIQAQEILNKYK